MSKPKISREQYMENIYNALERDEDGVAVGSGAHILKHPGQYSEDQIKWAETMHNNFESVGGSLKHDKDGLETMYGWLREMVERDIESYNLKGE